MSYSIVYSPEAYEDLRSIYKYIALDLLSDANAKSQIKRLRKAIRGLDTFPEGHTRVDWEPWYSLGMRYLPVDNYIVYYLTDKESMTVLIVRVFYSGRDVKDIIQSDNNTKE